MLIICAVAALTTTRVTVFGMDGAPHDPIKDSGGEPQAFLFVNHDCPICNAYSPEFKRLQRAFGGKVKIQLVFSEPAISPKAAKRYEKTYGLNNMSAWLDPTRRFAQQCGATIVPEAILFDNLGQKVWDGRIDDQWASLGTRREVATTHDLRDALKTLSQGKRPNPSKGKPVGCFILSPDTP